MTGAPVLSAPPRNESSPVASARRLALLAGEGALETLGRARALEAEGHTVIHLEVGEPDHGVAPHITEAAVQALTQGATRYGPPAGLPALREAIAASLHARGCRVAPDRVFVTPGAKSALFYSLLATVEEGDEVLIPDPGFPAYASIVRFAGGVAKPYGFVPGPDGSDRIDLAELDAAVTERTKVLVLNVPGNPTGVVLSPPDRARLAEFVVRNGLIVISDECYGRLLLDDDADAASIGSEPGLADRTIVVDGFSKSFGMTGWRLGYAVVPPAFPPQFATLMVNGHTCVAEFIQQAGLAALEGPQEWVSTFRRRLRRCRDRVVARLRGIEGVRCSIPRGAFYAFPDCTEALRRRGVRSSHLAARLLSDFHVAVLDGAGFGPRGAGHLRLSLAAETVVLDTAIDRLEACLVEPWSATAGRVEP